VVRRVEERERSGERTPQRSTERLFSHTRTLTMTEPIASTTHRACVQIGKFAVLLLSRSRQLYIYQRHSLLSRTLSSSSLSLSSSLLLLLFVILLLLLLSLLLLFSSSSSLSSFRYEPNLISVTADHRSILSVVESCTRGVIIPRSSTPPRQSSVFPLRACRVTSTSNGARASTARSSVARGAFGWHIGSATRGGGGGGGGSVVVDRPTRRRHVKAASDARGLQHTPRRPLGSGQSGRRPPVRSFDEG